MPASLAGDLQKVSFSTKKLWRLLLAGLVCLSCAKKQAPAPPPLAVEVATVIQKDVPITKEWIGSLDGFVNADIRPQVTGYVLRQVYKEGTFVRRNEVLFEIDPRQFQAALDQAKGFLAQNEAVLGKNLVALAPNGDLRGLWFVIVMMVVAVSWFFWLASREHDASGAPRMEPPARSRAVI